MGVGPDVPWDGGRQSRTDTAPRADRPCPAGPRPRSVRCGSRPGVFHARALGFSVWPGVPFVSSRARSGFSVRWPGGRPGVFRPVRCVGLPAPGQGPPGSFQARALRGLPAPVARRPPGNSSDPCAGCGASLTEPGSRPMLAGRGRRPPGPARRGTDSTGRLSSRASAGQICRNAAAARRRPGGEPSRVLSNGLVQAAARSDLLFAELVQAATCQWPGGCG